MEEYVNWDKEGDVSRWRGLSIWNWDDRLLPKNGAVQLVIKLGLLLVPIYIEMIVVYVLYVQVTRVDPV
jgi:hypothetical protein